MNSRQIIATVPHIPQFKSSSCFLEGLKSQLEDAREKLDEIRSSKAQQIARVNGADNPFLKVSESSSHSY